MVYRKRYGKRSMRRKYRRNRYKRNYNNGSSLRYKVMRIIKPELKFREQRVGPANMVVAGTVSPVLDITSAIAQGTSATNRVGDFIKPVTLHGSMSLTGFDGATAPVYRVRVFCICWKEQFIAATSPLIADLYQNTADPWSPFKPSARGTFKLLWSRKFELVNEQNNPKFSRVYNYKVPLSRLPTITWDVAIPNRNHLMFFAVSTFAIAEEATIEISNMFRYTDS